MEYPYFNTRSLSDGINYDLTDPVDRLKYFHSKLGNKIDDIKEYLATGSFVGYMMAKKQAGKGTYAKMVEDVLGPDRFAHISVGDVIRNTHESLENPDFYNSLRDYLEHNYRGFLSIEEALDTLRNRAQDKVSIPTEFLLALLKREISSMGRKALFIDGLPRNMDQVSASLYFRDLINYRDDPDFFIFIDAPMELINARMVNRRVCPLCHNSRNLLFTPTKFIEFDNILGEYVLICDNELCEGYKKQKYVVKEGDDKGITLISERLKLDNDLMEAASGLQGVPKIYIRSSYPVETAGTYVEDYEIQPRLDYITIDNKVVTKKSDWVFNDDLGVPSVTTYAAVYVVNLLTQIHSLLEK